MTQSNRFFLKKLVTIAFTAFAYSTMAAAGGSSGNGGSGIYVGNRLLLVDFVDNGLIDAPDFGQNDPAARPLSSQAVTTVHGCLTTISGGGQTGAETVDLIMSKLAQLNGRNHGLYIAYANAFCDLTWISVPGPLTDVEHPNAATDGKFVQLAIRRDNVVRLDLERIWTMPGKHRAGLFFHEATYYLLERASGLAGGAVGPTQSSDFIGQLFSMEGVFLAPHFNIKNVIDTPAEPLFWNWHYDWITSDPRSLATICGGIDMGLGWAFHGNDRSTIYRTEPVLASQLLTNIENALKDGDTLHVPACRRGLFARAFDGVWYAEAPEMGLQKYTGCPAKNPVFGPKQCDRLHTVQTQLNQWQADPK